MNDLFRPIGFLVANKASLVLNFSTLIVSEAPFSLDSKRHGTCSLTCNRQWDLVITLTSRSVKGSK